MTKFSRMPSTWCNCQQLQPQILAQCKWAAQLSGEEVSRVHCVVLCEVLLPHQIWFPLPWLPVSVLCERVQRMFNSCKMALGPWNGKQHKLLHDTTCQVCSVPSPNSAWSSTQAFAKDLRQFWSNSLASNNPKLIKRHMKVHLETSLAACFLLGKRFSASTTEVAW